MLRIIFVLVILGSFEYQTCSGDLTEDDWRKKGFYRPRRNYPSQSQNENSFQPSQNYQNQNTFNLKYSQSSTATSNSRNYDSQNPFGTNSQNTQRKNDFSAGYSQTSNTFGFRSQNFGASSASQTSLGQNQGQAVGSNHPDSESHYVFSKNLNSQETRFPQNTESQNSFRTRVNQNAFAINNNQNSRRESNSQNSFVSNFSQTQNRNQNVGTFSQNTQNQNSYASFRNFGQNGQHFGSNFNSQNAFRQQNVTSSQFSNYGSNSAFTKGQNYKAPGYLPPFKGPEYLPPEKQRTTFPPYIPPQTTTTRKPFITTTTRRPFYTTTTTRRPFVTTTTTRRPYFTTTTTTRPFFTTTTTRRPFFSTTTTKRPTYTYTTNTQRIFTVTMRKPAMAMKVPPGTEDDDGSEIIPERIGQVSPAMAMKVPPEPEDDELVDDFRTTTKKPFTPIYLPAMAMLVPPEQDDPTTTTSTTPSTTFSTTTTTTSTTPSTITSTTPSTTTTSTTPSTTISTTPSTTTSTTPPTTTTSTTPSTTTFTTPSTTTLTTPSTTTTSIIPSTTTSTTTPTTTTSTTSSTTTTTTTTSTPSTSTPDPNRNLIEEQSSPTTPTTTPQTTPSDDFQAPPYLPPRIPISYPPQPAMASVVPPEPECDPLDPSTYTSDLEQRSSDNPCVPFDDFRTTTKKPFAPVPLPAMAMPVPPEEDDSTTTTSTTPSTTTSTTTPKTTTSTTRSTTTSTTPSTTTTLTTPSTTTTTTTTFTPSTSTPDPNRSLIEEESSPTTPTTTPQTTPPDDTFKAPPYLPPRIPAIVPPKPAMASLVPPEPECDPLDPSTYPSDIDQRSGDNPCIPTTTSTTIKPVFRGPLYLPPPPKTRVGRSSNNTLRLGDLKGTPRPVWYAGIYKKTTDPYLPICGGSIVKEDVVISAAHCFWDDVVGQQPAALFAVAANKIYKPWRDPMDKKAQKSDVLDIKIPPRFLGAKTSFQKDLAILRLTTPFKYAHGLRPICVDFDVEFDRQQMRAGHQGTIAGWGYVDAKGTPTQRLLWLELPYVEIEKCIRDSEDSFLKYITCDKVCAGENDTGKALCRGDSGGGLAFWQGTPMRGTPYLRGVASTAPARRDAECNVFAYGSFTHVRAHRTFLRDHVPDIETCRFWEYE